MTTEKTLDVESIEDRQEREAYETYIAEITSEMLDRNPDMWYYVRQFEQNRITKDWIKGKWIK